VVAEQHALEQAFAPHDSEHVLPTGPAHVTELSQAFGSHTMLDLAESLETLERHAPVEQWMSQLSLAVHSTELEHAFAPHSTLHVAPPQTIELWHAPSPHVMSQLVALEQSIVLPQSPAAQLTLHGTPAGHVTVLGQSVPAQSNTQVPPAHAPPQVDATQGSAFEPHPRTATHASAIRVRIPVVSARASIVSPSRWQQPARALNDSSATGHSLA
jgi:hypothetical protein